jgi:hypothetical protein
MVGSFADSFYILLVRACYACAFLPTMRRCLKANAKEKALMIAETIKAGDWNCNRQA